MSASNQVQFKLIVESTYNVARGDDANAESYPLRTTGCSLKLSRPSSPSAELRADRNLANQRLDVIDVAGSLPMEMIYDDPMFILLQGALKSTEWAGIDSTVSNQIEVIASDNSYNSDGLFPILIPGDVIQVSGADSTQNNGTSRVVSSTSSKIIVSGRTLVDESTGENITIAVNTLVATVGPGYTTGSPANYSFAIEKYFSDFAQNTPGVTFEGDPYHHFSGLYVNTLAVKDQPNGFTTAEFGLMGTDMTQDDTSAPDRGYDSNEISTNGQMMGVDGSIYEGGTSYGHVTELSFNTTNNLATKHVVASKLTDNFTIGQFMASGSLTAFFGTRDLYTKFRNETPSSIRRSYQDSAGNGYTFEFNRVIFTDATSETNGVSGEVVVVVPWTATYDPTSGHSVRIRRHPALS